MKEESKTIWEIPPREPIPRQEVPGHGPDHPERQSEGTSDRRHSNKKSRKPEHQRSASKHVSSRSN